MFSARTNWPLAANRLAVLVERYRKENVPFLDLTESNPTRCGFRYDNEEIGAALRDPGVLAYEPDPRGLLPARQAVTEYYRECGVECDPQQIFLTTGTSEAYSHIFRLIADPGDSILVPRPSYPLLDFLARLDGLELVSYSLVYDRGWRMDLESLTRSLTTQTKAIVIIQPNNPTGSFVRKDELESVLATCQKHDLALISDEVFADYGFAPEAAQIRSGSCSRVLSFALSGLSKISGLPQMKLAWILVNGPAERLSHAAVRLEIITDTYLSVGAPLACALPRLLETRRALVPQILNRLRSNLSSLDGQLSKVPLVTRLATEGGWYVILKLPSTRSDEEWALEFLDREGVLVHPGHFYDFTREGYVVLSLLPRPEVFQQGIGKLLGRVSQTVA